MCLRDQHELLNLVNVRGQALREVDAALAHLLPWSKQSTQHYELVRMLHSRGIKNKNLVISCVAALGLTDWMSSLETLLMLLLRRAQES